MINLKEEEIKSIAGLPYNWEKIKDKTILVSGGTGFIGTSFIELIKYRNGEAYNISDDDEGLTLGEYAEYIASLANLKVRYEIENNESVSKATYALLDTRKIKNIGWEPQYSVKDGLKRTYTIKKETLGSM